MLPFSLASSKSHISPPSLQDCSSAHPPVTCPALVVAPPTGQPHLSPDPQRAAVPQAVKTRQLQKTPPRMRELYPHFTLKHPRQWRLTFIGHVGLCATYFVLTFNLRHPTGLVLSASPFY